MKKVAVVGNMNNNGAAIKCHLLDQGYDVHLYYTGHPHWKPDAEVFELKYCDNSTQLDSKLKYWPPRTDVVEWVKKEFSNYDFIIGMGREVSLLAYTGINLDVYIPYGGDIQHTVKYDWNWNVKEFLKILASPSRKLKDYYIGPYHKWVRHAIIHSRAVFFEKSNEHYEKDLADLKIQGQRFFMTPPFVYTESALRHFKKVNHPATHWRHLIDHIRGQSDIMIVYHGRQVWSRENENSLKIWDDMSKNVHFLIEGFAKYITEYPSSKVKLVMLEYHTDVDKSKKLMEELGITEHIHWLPAMSKKDLYYLIYKSDICSGEFNLSFLTFGTIVEAFLMGKTVLHYRDDSLYDNYESLPPIYNCREPEEVCSKIKEVVADPLKTKKMGLACQEWANQYLVNKPVDKIVDLIDSKTS